jgi:hypothetical protein
LAKAFWELDLDIPAVIRLGGNTEDRAVEILRRIRAASRGVEGIRRPIPAFIARAFASGRQWRKKWKPRPRVPKLSKIHPPQARGENGRVWIDTRWPRDPAAVETHSAD